MRIIYVDADACPVKDEIYRVAKRLGIAVKIVANSPMWIPTDPMVELITRTGFGAADDWIAEQTGPGDVVITADIPLAARAIERGSRVMDHRGVPFNESSIGVALAMRDLNEELRQSGVQTRGPSPMTPKDRSKFLSKLDEILHAIKREHPG